MTKQTKQQPPKQQKKQPQNKKNRKRLSGKNFFWSIALLSLAGVLAAGYFLFNHLTTTKAPSPLAGIEQVIVHEQQTVTRTLEDYQQSPHLTVYEKLFDKTRTHNEQQLRQWQELIQQGHKEMVEAAAKISTVFANERDKLQNAADNDMAKAALVQLEESVAVKERMFVNYFALEQDSLSALKELAGLLADTGGAPQKGSIAAELYDILLTRIMATTQQQATLLRAYKTLGEREIEHLRAFHTDTAKDSKPLIRNLSDAVATE